jgi:hypothetical protein
MESAFGDIYGILELVAAKDRSEYEAWIERGGIFRRIIWCLEPFIQLLFL